MLTLGPRLFSGFLELTPPPQLTLYTEQQVPISSSPQLPTTSLPLTTSKSSNTSSSISSPLKSEDKGSLYQIHLAIVSESQHEQKQFISETESISSKVEE